jgi:hypothetical protein
MRLRNVEGVCASGMTPAGTVSLVRPGRRLVVSSQYVVMRKIVVIRECFRNRREARIHC